jgi:hypothetical protein
MCATKSFCSQQREPAEHGATCRGRPGNGGIRPKWRAKLVWRPGAQRVGLVLESWPGCLRDWCRRRGTAPGRGWGPECRRRPKNDRGLRGRRSRQQAGWGTGRKHWKGWCWRWAFGGDLPKVDLGCFRFWPFLWACFGRDVLWWPQWRAPRHPPWMVGLRHDIERR